MWFPNLKININNKLPAFYKNIIQEWEELAICNPLTLENVFAQPIRYNCKILINRSVITWNEASDLFVQSFYDEDGRLMDWGNFKHTNHKNETFFLKWRRIVDAIPRGWKVIVGRDSGQGQLIVSPEPHLQVLTRRVNLSKLTGKEIYIILINKICEKPTSEDKIEQVLGVVNLNWSKVYMLGRRITLDSYSRQFHFKLTHNILFLNKALKRMNLVVSSMCSFCNIEEETPIHLFSECQYVIGAWGQVQSFFSSKLVLADLNPQSAILGWVQEDRFCILKNQILLIFKITLYKDRDLGRYGLDRFLNKLRMVRDIENGINTNNVYNKNKWEQISSILV